MRARHAPAGERLIRRYENRKLYDPGNRRYVTLDDLAQMVGEGDEIRVVDQKTGEDLTTQVLAQVILEGIKGRTARIPGEVLSRLIRLGFSRAKPLSEWKGPQEAAARAREEAERLVAGLLSRGRLTLEEALALRQGMAHAVHRIVAEAQRGLEGSLHGLLERTEREGVVPALKALKERLLTFETYLGPGERPGAARRGHRKSPRARGASRRG